MSTDPRRPIYHLMPPANWMNDPNGAIQWKGQYHLFYQHYPHGAFWSTMHWGHAKSADLVHWTHLPIAMAPTPDSPDQDGCWSGCAIDNAGTPTMIYTGVRGENQLPCQATGSDDLLTWKKHPGNPVIASPPAHLQVTGFRDHCVWRENDEWRMVIGSGIQGVGGAALLYRSPDLIQWDYMGPLCVGDKHETGEMWECPDFFPLGDRYALVISALPQGQVLYLVGEYANGRFKPDSPGVWEPGCFYAPQTMMDDRGRRLMWGWLREERSKEAQIEAGWSGVMSLPRECQLRPGGRLGVRPASEFKSLRGRHAQFRDVELAADSLDALAAVKGAALEILAEFEPGDAAACGLHVRCSPDGQEQTGILYDAVNRQLSIDRAHSSLSQAYPTDCRAPFELATDETLVLRVFLDHSVVEVFANERLCFASRIYPARQDSLGLELIAQGGRARIKSLDVWDMVSSQSSG